MKRGAIVSVLLLCLSVYGWFGIPNEVRAAAVAAFSLLTGTALLLWDAATAVRRKRRVRANPLDPVLRPLVASELFWENASLAPHLSEPALAFLGFLVTEHAFSPATVSPGGRRVSFRKGAFEIRAYPSDRAEPSGFVARLYDSANTSRVRAERRYDADHVPELADGAEGLGRYLRRHVDDVEAGLRRGAVGPAV